METTATKNKRKKVTEGPLYFQQPIEAFPDIETARMFAKEATRQTTETRYIIISGGAYWVSNSNVIRSYETLEETWRNGAKVHYSSLKF